MKYALRGYLLAGSSVLLTTLAQLTMKWGMIHLPHFALSWFTSLILLENKAALCLEVAALPLICCRWFAG